MLARLLPLGALMLLPAALRPFEPAPPAPPAAGALDRPVAALFPERTLILVEAPGIADLLERGLDDPFVARVLTPEVEQLVKAGAGASLADLLAFADAYAGRPVLPTLAALARGGAAVGFGFAQDHGTWTLALQGDDPEELRAVLQDVFRRVEQRFGAEGSFREPHLKLAGADAWRLGDETLVAVRGALLAAGNDEETLKALLELAADPAAAGVTARATYKEALIHGGEAPLLRAFVDLERLEALASMGGKNDLSEMRKWPGTPAVQLLLGPSFAAIGTARALGARADLEGDRLELRMCAPGAARPGPLEYDTERPLPPAFEPHPADVASALVYRDLGGAFVHRAALFPPDAGAAFAKAESDFALFLGGAELVEDVLGHVSPWGRVIVRRAQFEAGAAPENPLPAAALVVALDGEAETLGPRLVSAFQTLIGIVNVDRAQKGETGFLLGLENVGGATLTTAKLPRPGPEDGVDLAYNLAPACAALGDTFVLSTHASLARELLAELADRPTGAPAAAVERLRASGEALAAFIDLNLETLVLRNSLDKGHSPDAARVEIGWLRALLAALGETAIELRRTAEDRVELAWTLAPERGSGR